MLVEIFKKRWKELSGGKPIVATVHIFEEVSLAGLLEIWNEYAVWRRKVMPSLAEEERCFQTKMNGNAVWVMEDSAAFAILYPEDY